MDPETAQRFEETDRRFAGLEALIREMWADLKTGHRHLATRIDQLEAKVDQLEAKVDRLEAKVDQLEAKVDRLEAKADHLVAEVGSSKRVANENFARIQRNFELLLAEVRDPADKARLDAIEARLVRLEQHVGLLPDE